LEGVPVEIRTKHFPNTNLKCYLHAIPLGEWLSLCIW
jgi:hypothetical protein